MVDFLSGGIRLDTGIERVIVGDRQGETSRLPDLAEILPSREQLKAELDHVLPASRLVQLLDDFLAPQVESGELLFPGGFQTAFEGLCETVTASAGTGGNELRRAARLLRDEQDSRELLQNYRTTLYGA